MAVIQDFAVELIEKILEECVRSRSVARALRLKLVCKSFKDILTPSFLAKIFAETKAIPIEQIEDSISSRDWRVRKYSGATLWHDYLVQRCLNKTDASFGRFVEMRNVANLLLQHCETHDDVKLRLDCPHELKAILDHLCWLALERGTDADTFRDGWAKRKGAGSDESYDRNRNLLAAATFFGVESIVEQLLDDGVDPTRDNGNLPSAMTVAAYTGQNAMVARFQEHLRVEESRAQPASRNPRGRFGTTFWPGLLQGTAMRGDVAALRLVLFPPSREMVDDPNAKRVEQVLGLEAGSLPSSLDVVSHMNAAMEVAGSVEAFRYLWDFTASFGRRGNYSSCDTYGQSLLRQVLRRKVEAGDIAMVRRCLELRVPLAPGSLNAQHFPHLAQAVRAGHDEIVDLLLEGGATTEPAWQYRPGSLLTRAAKLGSMTILRKLLEAGAKLDPMTDFYTLRAAINLEHTEMVEFLLGEGEGLWPQAGLRRQAVVAKEAGLESMVALLESRLR